MLVHNVQSWVLLRLLCDSPMQLDSLRGSSDKIGTIQRSLGYVHSASIPPEGFPPKAGSPLIFTIFFRATRLDFLFSWGTNALDVPRILDFPPSRSGLACLRAPDDGGSDFTIATLGTNARDVPKAKAWMCFFTMYKGGTNARDVPPTPGYRFGQKGE